MVDLVFGSVAILLVWGSFEALKRLPPKLRVRSAVAAVLVVVAIPGAFAALWYSHTPEEGVQAFYSEEGVSSTVEECEKTEYFVEHRDFFSDTYSRAPLGDVVWKCRVTTEGRTRTECWVFLERSFLRGWEAHPPPEAPSRISPAGSGCVKGRSDALN
jgi:hypothetical protein